MRGAVFVVLAGVFCVLLGLFAVAGEYRTLAVSGADVSYTNAQANSQWDLTGVLFKWDTLPASTVTVSRVSGGVEWLLSASAAPTASMWWVPEGRVTFKTGDVVRFGCGGGTGTVQVLYGRCE